LRRANPSLSNAQAVSKALKDEPDLYAGIRRHELRKAGLLADSPGAIEKQDASLAPLQAAASRIRAADPSLTREQAVAKALDDDPSLYHANH
jgi:hypothetical protein